jgi:hypothetical protein
VCSYHPGLGGGGGGGGGGMAVTIMADTQKRQPRTDISQPQNTMSANQEVQSLRQERQPNSMVNEDLKCNLSQLKLALLDLGLLSTKRILAGCLLQQFSVVQIFYNFYNFYNCSLQSH